MLMICFIPKCLLVTSRSVFPVHALFLHVPFPSPESFIYMYVLFETAPSKSEIEVLEKRRFIR